MCSGAAQPNGQTRLVAELASIRTGEEMLHCKSYSLCYGKGFCSKNGAQAPAASRSSRRCLTWPLVGTAERRDTPAKLLLISAAAMASVLMPGVSLGGCQSEQLGIEAGLIHGWKANLPSAGQATNPCPTWRAPIGAAPGFRSW